MIQTIYPKNWQLRGWLAWLDVAAACGVPIVSVEKVLNAGHIVVVLLSLLPTELLLGGTSTFRQIFILNPCNIINIII